MLQAQRATGVQAARRMGARTTESHAEKTAPRAWSRAGTRPSTLAQCLLRRPGAIPLSHSPRASEPISKENPLTGKPDARNGPVRFGGRGEVQSLVPTLSRRFAREGAAET